MNSLDQFRNRAMTVRTLTLCEHCKELCDEKDVTERANWWPPLKLTSCGACYRKLLAQVQSPVAC